MAKFSAGSSKKVVDLRGRRPGRKPPAGQTSLFSRAPRSSTAESARRASPLRTRRRRVRAIKTLMALMVVGGVAWGVSYASYLPELSIRHIVVQGTQKVPEKLVRDYVATILDDGSYHYISRKNIFIYPRAVIERAVVGYFPRIKSASVSRPSLLSTDMVVGITERQPFALWCMSGGQCYEMDDRGFIFAEASASEVESARPGAIYVFEGGVALDNDKDGAEDATAEGSATSSMRKLANPIGRSFVPAHLPGIITLLRLLGQAGFTPAGAIVENDRDFTIPLSGEQGFYIKASFGQDAGRLTHDLELVLDSDILRDRKNEIEYIDLRFGDRAYYKLIGEEEVSAQ
ncbi:MAG: hypothetical protein NUV59_03165 [Patescibacteria group bacterium]|nr:hypothetical protein [Patescibacteria group bacterium]